MGFRSLKASAPTRRSSRGIEPPPAHGSTTRGPRAGRAAQRLVGGLRESPAGFEVLGDRGVIPVGEVGDEVEQCEPELVKVKRVGRVERQAFLRGQDDPFPLAERFDRR